MAVGPHRVQGAEGPAGRPAAGDCRLEAGLDELAERWREVQTLRAYFAAADGSPAAQADDYPGWRAWAMAEADAADPLRDGSTPFARLAPFDQWDWRGW